MVEPQLGGTYADLLGIARAAEQAGYTAIARSDHYLAGETSVPATEALSTIAGLARETETIKLAVLVTPLTFRHPAVIAKTAATLDEMSSGRFELGIGTGWMESEHRVFGIDLPAIRTRFSLLFETLAYVHAAFGRSDGGYQGRHHRLEDVPVLPLPVGRLPIVVGGTGMKRTPTLAGRFADEYNMFACDAETLSARLRVMRETAEELERDPEAVKVSVMSSAIIGADAAEYREMLAAAAAARAKESAEFEETLRARRILHGTYGQAAEQIAQYAAEGVDRVYIQHFDPLDELDTSDIAGQLRGLRG
jgi:alkanesulfonate monooxygenase SsuD/methylene tetrahydromethanopterin reductase-like flavin-dependent oxidoreductase (luciferase family)